MQALRDELKALVIQTLDLKDVTPGDVEDEAPLFGDGLGLDSLDALGLAVAFEFQYGLEVKLDGASEDTRAIFHSVASLADFIAANRSR